MWYFDLQPDFPVPDAGRFSPLAGLGGGDLYLSVSFLQISPYHFLGGSSP